MDTKTLCLGVLSLGHASGYEIKKAFERVFSHFFSAGFGSIYPALSELTERGLVDCTDVEQERRPAKKVYGITSEGWAVLREELGHAPPNQRVRSEFLVLMFFAHLLPEERLDDLIDLHIEALERDHRYLSGCAGNSCGGPPGGWFTAGYGEAVMAASLRYVKENRQRFVAEVRRLRDEGRW